MSYVNGYVLPVQKNKLAACRRLANWARKAWVNHGALGYKECTGADLKPPL